MNFMPKLRCELGLKIGECGNNIDHRTDSFFRGFPSILLPVKTPKTEDEQLENCYVPF